MWHPVPKPRHLALGELPRGGDGGVQRLRPASSPARQRLQRAAGPAAWRRAAPDPGPPAPGPPPARRSSIASNRAAMRARRVCARRVEHKGGELQSLQHRRGRLLLPFRQRPAGGLEHFIGAQHALRIGGAQLARPSADRARPGAHAALRRRSRPAARGRPRALRRAWAECRPGLGQRHEIKPGAADEDRHAAHRARLGQRLRRILAP